MNDATGEIVKVTPSDASYWSGSWSADNATLIYYGAASVFADQGDMYSFDLQSRTSRRLTTGGGRKMFPTLTSDGTLIAYHKDWRLYFLSLDGVTDRRVMNVPDSVVGQMQWSSRGDFLFFQAFANGRWDIYRLNRNGSGLANLTQDSFQAYTPVLSPDDMEIAYVAETGTLNKVYLMNIDGKNKRPLTKLNQREFSPSWGR
jgi:Tol biopolymer transport system component